MYNSVWKANIDRGESHIPNTKGYRSIIDFIIRNRPINDEQIMSVRSPISHYLRRDNICYSRYRKFNRRLNKFPKWFKGKVQTDNIAYYSMTEYS